MIDAENIFDLFEPEPGSEEVSVSTKAESKDLKDYPNILMRIFVKIVFESENIPQGLLDFLVQVEYEPTMTQKENIIKRMVIFKAYQYLQLLDLNRDDHVEAILNENTGYFLKAINRCINFYAQEEEYERCQVLKSYSDFIKFTQNKLPLW